MLITVEDYNREIDRLEKELAALLHTPASAKQRRDMTKHLFRLKKELGEAIKNMRKRAEQANK